jgi:hypothetical protein
MEVEFVGILTGRVFRFDRMRALALAGSPGTSMGGHHEGADVESGEPVYVREAQGLSPHDAPTLDRVRHAIAIARLPVVANCPTIVRLLDYEDKTNPGYGFGDHDVVRSVWQWGERVLLDEIVAGAYDASVLAAEVEVAIGTALACLHSAGLVHSDVAPNNIVRVAGVWKLADLDNVVREGEPVTGVPQDRCRVDDVDVGDLARREMDEHGLRAVVERIISGV